MGNYINFNLLQERVGAAKFASLCGVTGTALTTLVDNVISRAEAVVDGFASARYSVPLQSSELVVEWTLCIAEYEIYKRGPGFSVPEKIAESYRTAVSQLSELAAGRFSTGSVLTAKTVNVNETPVKLRGNASVFDDGNMKSF